MAQHNRMHGAHGAFRVVAGTVHRSSWVFIGKPSVYDEPVMAEYQCLYCYELTGKDLSTAKSFWFQITI